MRGKVALVTGGTRGLGAALARRLVRDGLHVAAVYASNEVAATELADELSGSAGTVSIHACDVGREENCRDLVMDVGTRYGGIDYLINNAGLLEEARISAVTAENWNRLLAVNLSSAFFLTQAVWDHMSTQRFGRIVNVSSVTAVMGNPRELGYAAAKAGLIGLTRSSALAGARRGITVNCIVPGVFATDMTAGMDDAAQAAILKMIPLGRHGDPDEMAHAMQFLLDDRAGYVTGAVLVVDGGLSMGS